MTVEDKEALFGEAVAQLHHYSGGDPGYKNVLAGDVRTTAEALGDARELKGHVEACILRDWSALPQGKRELTQSEVEDLLPKCGQGGWYCDRAPKEGRERS